MSFRLSQTARDYFRRIDDNSTTGKFETLWDKYYLCLVSGLVHRRLGQETGTDAEFITSFIAQYFDQRFEIIAAFVAAEMARKDIPVEEKEIRRLMVDLLNPNSPTYLTDEGHRLMNRYAEGGFEVIRDAIPDPFEFDLFMKEFYDACVKPKRAQ